MKWEQMPLGALQTNCYIFYNNKNECIIFDPGAEGENVNQYIEDHGFKPLAIMLTHAHFDHIGAVDHVRKYWKIPVYIHELEAEWLIDPSLNGSRRFGANIMAEAADYLISNESTITIGEFSFELLYTPGHSPGSISYYSKAGNTVIAGDTLFAGSIGRTDLLGGDHQQLLASIKNELLCLPTATIVLPGHGPATTINKEMTTNPFLS